MNFRGRGPPTLSNWKTIRLYLLITVFRWEQGCKRPSHALASPFHLSSPLRYRCPKTVTPRLILESSLARPPPPRRLPALLPDCRLPRSHALGMALHQWYNYQVMLVMRMLLLMFMIIFVGSMVMLLVMHDSLGMALHQWYNHQVYPGQLYTHFAFTKCFCIFVIGISRCTQIVWV